MPRPNNTIQKIRANAWHLLSLYTQGLMNESYAGADLLAMDDLACKLYRAMVTMDKEDLAVARHAFEEFYDLGPGQMPSDPYERPPEITAQLKAQGLIAN